jgi:hypothetical protein
MPIIFAELQDAFEFVSAGAPGENRAISTGSQARSIVIPSTSTSTMNCPTISTTRSTFQFLTRESSISASL